MRLSRLLCGLLVATAVITISGCGLGSDSQPTSLSVPEDVFPSEAPGTNEIRPSADATVHPVYFFKEDLLVQIQRPLPAPVFLDAPLNNLLEGPTEIEAESGYASAIPAGTAIVDVALLRNNTISIHLNQTFFEIEGEQRIRASAQLVLTASDLVSDTQGVVFFLEGKPVQLPDGEGLIEEVGEGRLPSPLTVADYAALIPASE
ncbi:MAG: GerMN domain-containing protein [Acidimicrobiales bacterium]|nr:GerMN domain-containing protein [Acidimicrobiales bacterium]